MAILSVQSHVAYGHVGNAAAVFPLQRLGFEVWPIYTVQFSNHTGYEGWTGQVFEAAHIEELIRGIAERGVLESCEAVLSGYLGAADVGAAVLGGLARVRVANPKALYACDPVMGDREQGLFVRSGIPEFMGERAVPAADIVTPNQFELEVLTGLPAGSLQEALAGARNLLALGPRVVVVTSVRHEGIGADEVAMLAVTKDAAWQVVTPFITLDPAPNGAGDTLAALFLGFFLRGEARDDWVPGALALAADAIYGLIEETRRAGTRELQLIAGQEACAKPRGRFSAVSVA